MDSLLVKSVKSFLNDNIKKDDLNDFLNFYDKLRLQKDVELIYKNTSEWFLKTYEIKNFKIEIISTKESKKENLFISDSNDDFKNPNELLKEYKVSVNDELIISYAFICNHKKQYIELSRNNEFISTLFYMITPLISSVSYQQMIKNMTIKDAVTNTYNRQYLNEYLSTLLPLARRENRNVSFLMVGIDHFKAVIDEFDYEIGDKLLKNLASVLKHNIRESDLLVRIDNDEFLITLSGVTQKEDSLKVAQKLIDTFADYETAVNTNGNTLKKTICIGITHYDYEENSIENIIKNADISLYEARNLGRSCIKVYEPEKETGVDLF